MTFSELGKSLGNIKQDVVLRAMINDNKQTLIDANRRQLREGERKDGTQIGTYLPYTIQKRQERGLQTSYIDLYYEGGFYSRMYVETKGMTFLISSKDWKLDMLEDRYGEMILGISNENKKWFMEQHGMGYIAKYISWQTGLKLK